MSTAVLTPWQPGQAIDLGNRSWWKRLLPIGEIDYKGRTLKFTRDYLSDLVKAFRSGAYDQVPFQLADHANTHTNDPERTRGEIADMDLRDDGLWIRLNPTAAGDQVLTSNPHLGVSARIVEDYHRADGAYYPAAIQHVLGTLDPRIPGLGPWQAIEAAGDVPEQVIDLSASIFDSDPDAGPPAPTTGGTGMDLDHLSAEHQARLARLLELPEDQLAALAAGGVVVSPDELDALTGEAGDGDVLSDAELDDLIAAAADLDEAGLLDDDTAGQPEGELAAAGLSAEAQFELDLANARSEETSRELSVITARLREQDYLNEARRFADLGVPPYIVEMARPLLEGAGRTVELANGRTADAGQIMRKVLTEYANAARLLDLDVELGSPMDGPPDGGQADQAVAHRTDVVNRFKTVTGLS